MKHLYLSGNEFREIPSPILQLTQLEYLDVSQNNIAQITDSLRYLKLLNELGLDDNVDLEELPPHFCELQNLENLYIQNTKINTLPSCLNQIASLKRIRLCKTVIQHPEALEAVFKSKLDWEWHCPVLEHHLVDFHEIYGTYSTRMKMKTDSLILYYHYSYDEPGAIDEEFSQNITIRIAHKDSLQFNHIYTATSSLFTITTLHSSVWDWEDAERPKVIRGYLLFKKLSEKECQVYLNLYLIENGKKRKLTDRFLTFQ
jgi:hypothetical protein